MAVAFKAPVKDIVFGYEVVETYDVISKIPAFSDFNEDIVIPTMEECAKFAEEVLAPINAIGDQQGATIKDGKVTMPKEFIDAYKSFSEAGWASISLPSEIGGGGMPIALSGGTLEILSTANLAFGLAPGLAAGAISAINFHGSEEQKAKFLPKLVSGEWTGTMNLSEPQSGSDLGTITTKAEPQEDGSYKITGTKVWITFGEHDLTDNIIHLVLAKIPGSPEGTKGISMFIVPKVMVNDDGSLGDDNNVSCISIEEKLGIHASPTCVMEYDGSVGYLVGEENRGLNYMFTMMNDARIGVACESVAIAERAYQQAVLYAKDRVQGTTHISNSRVTIINHPDVRRMILSMKSLIEIMRVLVYENTFECDLAESKPQHGKRADLLTPITKAWCSELCQDITSIALQVHGGMGYVEETGAAQHFRDARITTIYEGTTGIQANDLIGRKFIGDNGSGMNDLLNEIEKEIEVADVDTEMRNALNQAIGHARNVSSFILENYQKEPNLPGACGHNFLMMMGYLVGGWIAVRNITASKDALEESDDSQFYNAKIISSNFYIEQFLPLVSSFGSSAMHGSGSMMSMPDEQF